MEFQRAMQQIGKAELSSNYTLFGTEIYLRHQILTALFQHLGDRDALDMSRFDLSEVDLDLILDEADSFSFFADKRVIIVENAQALVATTAKTKISETAQKRLLAYFDNPNPSSLIIWLVETTQLDKRKKLTKALQTQTTFIDILPLNESQVAHYVRDYAKDAGIKLQPKVLEALLVRVNYQLSVAMSELLKLQQYAQGEKPLTVEVVNRLVPRSLETDVFELVSAVVQHQSAKAVQIYRDLILAKNEPIALHALLVSQFRLLIQVKLLSQVGYLESEMATRLGIHPYRVKLALQTVRSLSLEQLQRFYVALAEADYAMKTSSGPREAIFDILVTKW